ncbi:hypothetical protein ACP275_11G100400 [Erythranthe tilingii]
MAAKVFVKMPQRNCHKIVENLIHAVLEWILILLLLLNSSLSHLIQKFAKYFALKPICTWCTRFDHIFDSKKIHAQQLHRNYHVCEAHGIEIAKLSYCTNHRRLAESKNLCGDCSSFRPSDRGNANANEIEISPLVDFFINEGIIVQENNEGNDLVCSCCDQIILSRNDLYPPLKPSYDVLDYTRHDIQYEETRSDGKKTESCDFMCDSNLAGENFGDLILQNEEEYLESDGFICIELIDSKAEVEVLDNFPVESKQKEGSLDGGVVSETEHLKASLKAQEKAMSELYEELEEERKSAAISANQTMAMINKLQEEKSAMQMEALHYQRMMEEQSEYDQEALQLLNDLVSKREREKRELEKELEMYRFDLDFENEHEGIIVNNRQEDGNSEVECIKRLTVSDISLAEFDEERICILEELKVLEAKLFSSQDDNDETNTDRMSKKLLPLFDEAEDKILIEEGPISNAYDRLQMFESDNEFVNHCIRSTTEGNKGIVLLQEILQHLRDLRSVEYSFRKLAEIPLP